VVNTIKSQQNIKSSLLILEEKVGQLAKHIEDIAMQSLNSLYDPNLDFTKKIRI